ncbi:hypothetical protein BH11PSE11_BH11PSE11_30110 [soil metagenome]
MRQAQNLGETFCSSVCYYEGLKSTGRILKRYLPAEVLRASFTPNYQTPAGKPGSKLLGMI